MYRTLVVLFVSAMAACGGTQPPPPAQPVTTPPPVEAPAAPEPEHVYYEVYWDDIHVLTVYRGAGVLRSEEPSNPGDRFSGMCGFMTASSHYFEKETEMRALVDAADNLEEFLQSLTPEDGYDVEEAWHEEGY